MFPRLGAFARTVSQRLNSQFQRSARPYSRAILAIVAVTVLVLVTVTFGVPESEVRVVSFEPSGKVDRQVNFTISFSKKMVAIDSVDLPVLTPPVSFSPPIKGIARWIEDDVLRIFPDQELSPATSYTATVRSEKTWISGLKLGKPSTFKIQTPFLSLIDRSVSVEQIPTYNDSAFLVGRLQFNYPVSVQELQSKLRIEGENEKGAPPLTYSLTPIDLTTLSEFEWNSSSAPVYSRDFTFKSSPIIRSDKSRVFLVVIEKGLGCQECGTPLADNISVRAIVEPRQPLLIHHVAAFADAEQIGIRVNFSQQINADDIRPLLKIEPGVEYRLDADWSTLVVRGDFRSGEVYTVTIAKNLLSRSGQLLDHDFSAKVLIPDLQPTVSFTSKGVFLPKSGNGNLELKTINIEKLQLEVEQVFANNLVYFLLNDPRSDYYGRWDQRAKQLGKSLFLKEFELNGEKNRPLLTSVDVGSIIGDSRRGAFMVSARARDERWTADSRYVMLTDLGMTARLGNDYMMVWVNSLVDASPISGVKVTLYSRNNQTLAQGFSNSRGVAIFKNLRDTLAAFQPFVITAEKNSELSYLRLDESRLPLADFDVSGRPFQSSGYDAFLATERGVYRPGDTVHIGAMIRTNEGELPPTFPYFINVIDPQGRKAGSYRQNSEQAIYATLDHLVPDYAMTGKYQLQAMIGEDLQIGRAEFLVEEFVPDKIAVTVKTDKNQYATGDKLRAAVQAKLLFGPPAAGYQMRATVTLESHPFAPAGYSGYSFNSANRTFVRLSTDLPEALLNDSGNGSIQFDLPKQLFPPSSLKALVSTSVSEAGGRAIGAYAEVFVHPYKRYLGIGQSKEGFAKIGEPFKAKLVSVAPSGERLATTGCIARVYRIIYHSLYTKDPSGNYRWISERKSSFLESDTINISADGGEFSFIPTDYGSYQIVVEEPNGHAASIDFWATGWGYAPWGMESPDRIELVFDKPSYSIGDQAVLQVRAPFGGKLLLTVEQGEVYETITKEMTENTATIELPVLKEYLPNVYVTATVLRPALSLESNKPSRAFGMTPLRVSTESKKLKLEINAPEVVKPNSKLTVQITIEGAVKSRFTVAAVDAGILQLTDFKTPDPLEHFYGKRQPALTPYDHYALVYPFTPKAKSHLSAGDKLFAANRKRSVNPISARRIRSVALWSGVVTTDKNGRASVDLAIPEFNGSLRLMAIGTSGELFGVAERDVIVRDKIVLQEHFPRFVSPNDQFEGLVTVFNNSDTKRTIDLKLVSSGPVALISDSILKLEVEPGREGRGSFRLRGAQSTGKVVCKVLATSQGDSSGTTIEFPNRPALPLVTKFGSGSVKKGQAASIEFPGDWIAGTERYIVQTSGMPATNFTRNIDYLLSYPYGCVEQTTSRLFPLLYYDGLVKVAQPELIGTKGHEYFIQEGIARLTSMIQSDWSFSYWPGGGYSNPWGSIYATHFLSEASRAGFLIDTRLLDNLYGRLDQIARGRLQGDEYNDAHRYYAAYVLALAGKLPKGTIHQLQRVEPTLLDVQSRYFLAGALTLGGNRTDALRYLPNIVQPDLTEPETGGTFRSGVRVDAIALEILMAVTPDNPSVDVIAKSLMERASAGRWYTTQENAFALMAIGKYFKKSGSMSFKGTLGITGKAYPIDSTGFKLTRSDIGGKQATLEITEGDGTAFYYWQASGVPTQGAAMEFDRGIKVRREYLTEDAALVDLSKVKLGDRLVVVVSIESTDRQLENVIIADLLPAGVEIENPRLKTTPRLSWIPTETSPVDYQDIRDDRILIATRLWPQRVYKYYYSVRAVSAGDFKIPPVSAECMYNPLIASSASSGAMHVDR